MPPGSATTVRLDRGDPLVTDGPFVEGNEVVSGFTEIDVADLDEARSADKRALERTANPAEQSLLRQRIAWT